MSKSLGNQRDRWITLLIVELIHEVKARWRAGQQRAEGGEGDEWRKVRLLTTLPPTPGAMRKPWRGRGSGASPPSRWLQAGTPQSRVCQQSEEGERVMLARFSACLGAILGGLGGMLGGTRVRRRRHEDALRGQKQQRRGAMS